jgi:hypothetical protein
MKLTIKILSIPLFGFFALAMAASANLIASPLPQQGGGGGQGPGGERRPGLFGKVTAIHDQSIELSTPDGNTVTVKISGDTQFRKDRESAKLSDFKVGDMVGVRGQENPDHTWTAQSIGARTGGPGGGGFAGRPGGAGQGGPGGSGGGPGGAMRPSGVLGQDYVVGEVKSIDAPKLTILRPDNVTQTIELNEESSLRKGRDSITMADIQAGDHVFVRGAMKENVFQPASVNVISPEQWKRMQENGAAGANPPKDTQQQKPPEPPH